MKNKTRLISFLMGAVTALTLAALSLPALAATGAFTITALPINVMVNGEIFRPKDAKGNDALVFAYNGTTYAPLRALAEAYGLEVSYDSSRNMAAVNDPGRAAAPAPAPAPGTSSFSSQWTVTETPVTNYGTEKIFNADYSGSMSTEEFKAWWKSMDLSTIRAECEKMAAEAQELVPGYTVTMYFSYGNLPLGNANAMNGYTVSNFDLAGAWIK